MTPSGASPSAQIALDEAFLDTDFNWTMALEGIWSDPPTHVPELHGPVVDEVMRDFRKLGKPTWTQALGKVLSGPIGSGKTHLVSALRRRVFEAGGWFVHVDIVGMTDFWRTVVLGFVESLRHPLNGAPQYEAVFKATLRTIDPAKAKMVVFAAEDLGSGATATVNQFVKLLKVAHPSGQKHADVVRALLLQRDPDTMDTAYAWLQGLDVPSDDRAKLGLVAPPPPPVEVVQGISWLMGLGGPTMIAVDQIDSIISMGNIADGAGAGGGGEIQAKARAVFELLAGGLMDLRDQTRRSMTVLSCYAESWDIVATKALGSVSDRFKLPPLILREDASTPAVVAALVELRLARSYDEAGVAPPNPLWPFNDSFCEEVKGLVPRQILRRCEEHRQSCERIGRVTPWSGRGASDGKPEKRGDLDALYARLRAEATPPAAEALYAGEGDVLAGLLRHALDVHARHLTLGPSDDVEVEIEAKSAKPVLHARLKVAPAGAPDHQHCFRVLGHAHHRAFQPRLAAAITAAGIDKAMPRRRLAILRAIPFPGGRVTDELKASFAAGGGVVIEATEGDVRAIMALRAMAEAKTPGLDTWLTDRRPLGATDLFKALALDEPPWTPAPEASELATATGAAVAPTHEEASSIPPPATFPGATSSTATDGAARGEPTVAAGAGAAIPLGRRIQGSSSGGVVELPVALLTRHTAMFAGSGSGKTVLLRRIVEEAALVGIPSIVLDTNNDLARLGTPWPSPPEGWAPGDEAKAARYARDVDVVVWTPGVAAGRPLALPMLPDFSRLDDREERAQAVDMAWATLTPLVGATGASKSLKEGLLKQALAAFAAERREGIEAFIDFLMDLPGEVSKLRKADELAAGMGDQLRAKIAVNPLLGGGGQILDPAMLFTSDRPGATRVSVINFAGLEVEASRQDFVNQLQMALFAYIRRSPSATPRLYICDEAQNFAPSGASTASKASAVALARQGRKFGLGMVFATQAPRGIDTNIVSNCVTHFYGRMASPALMDAAEAMMASRGKAAKDLGALSRGTFYVSTEGMAQPIKTATPNCLTYHPQNPATPDEVVGLSQGA